MAEQTVLSLRENLKIRLIYCSRREKNQNLHSEGALKLKNSKTSGNVVANLILARHFGVILMEEEVKCHGLL